jgi:hypothetical protein
MNNKKKTKKEPISELYTQNKDYPGKNRGNLYFM